jgi:protein SCO1/2
VAHAQPAGPEALEGTGVEEHVGARLPLDVRFHTSQGRSVALGEVLGNGTPTLLVLAYNRCTMLCSLVLRGVVDLVQRSEWTPGREVGLVWIGIDPRETSDESARTQATVLQRIGHPDQPQRWPFLVGNEAAIRAVAGALGFEYRWDPRTEQFAHPAVLFAIGANGTIEHYFYGLRHDPAEVAAALRGDPPPRVDRGSIAAAVLSCFRFDPMSRRYGGAIRILFRVGAALVFLALVAGIGLLTLRRRDQS